MRTAPESWAAAPAAQLSAGAYVWHLGSQRFQFEVPAEAVVQLSERTLDSGASVAVFTATDGTELIVDPATLPAAAAPADGQFSAVVEPTLAALAATLRQAPPRQEAAAPTAGPPQECPVAAADAQGIVAIALDTQICTVVRGGGSVTVSRGDASRAFPLDATLDWLVIRWHRRRRRRGRRGPVPDDPERDQPAQWLDPPRPQRRGGAGPRGAPGGPRPRRRLRCPHPGADGSRRVAAGVGRERARPRRPGSALPDARPGAGVRLAGRAATPPASRTRKVSMPGSRISPRRVALLEGSPW